MNKDNYGNRYRFYEMKQAHKKGEDLSQFTAKNKPEEELLAKLSGGSTGGSSGGGIPDFVMEYPLNNPNNTDFYYGMNLVGVKKIRVNLPKLAQAYAALEGYNSAEELFNGVVKYNYKNPKKFQYIFDMLYTEIMLCGFDSNVIYTETKNAYIKYGFAPSNAPTQTYLVAVYLGDKIIQGIRYPSEANTLTEYEILQQLGTVEFDIEEMSTNTDPENTPDKGEYYYTRVPIMQNFGYRTDDNGKRIFFNLNDIQTPDWIEFVH
jgi:hypothetical protein